MKTKVLFLLTLVFCLFSLIIYGQNLTQADFLSVSIPKITGSGTSNRLPIIWRGTVQNLTANKTYRYYSQAARYTDLGTSNTGAGNTVIMNPDSAVFVYTTSPSIKNAGAYGIFKTDASGKFTGWFGAVYTSNARFTPGNYVIPTILIADDTITVAKLAMNDSIYVTSLNTNAADTNSTGIWGISSGAAKNLILLYDNAEGSGKPLSIAYIEDEGVAVSSIVKFYSDSVNGKVGRWGTIIPNVNAGGVRRIEQRSLANGSIISYNTSANGIWSSVSTVNPNGGLSAIKIDSLGSTIPVELVSFSGAYKGSAVELLWKTATETNNYGFEVERKESGRSFYTVAFINGQGSKVTPTGYSYTDKSAQAKNYIYRLKQIDFNGSYQYSDEISVNNATVKSFALKQNYPNPFNPSTVINYEIPVASYVVLKVYNVIGSEVATLVNGRQEAGSHTVNFSIPSGKLASGIYLYKLQAGSYTATRKMTLLR